MDQKSTVEDFRRPQGRISVRQQMYILIPHAEHSLPLHIYRLQNVASSTYLDLDNGNNVDGMKMNYRWRENFIDSFLVAPLQGRRFKVSNMSILPISDGIYVGSASLDRRSKPWPFTVKRWPFPTMSILPRSAVVPDQICNPRPFTVKRRHSIPTMFIFSAT